MKQILVAVDGSECATKALNVAATLAKSEGAGITLIHVLTNDALSKKERHMIQIEYAEDLMLRVPWGQAPSSNADNYVKALMTQHADTSDAVRAILSERLMSDAQKRLQEAGVDNVATLFEEGDAAERIVAAAKSQNADTIVMGTRGMNDLRGLVVGSVSHKVAHEATGTVVMVK